MPRPRSLRVKFLLVILAGVLLPLALVGFWLARGAERSGETVLRARLNGALVPLVAEIGVRWVQVRSELLSSAAPEEDPGTAEAARGVSVSLPVYSRLTRDSIGSINRRIPIGALVPTEVAGGAGGVLAVFDRASGSSLIPVPFDPALLERNEFTWGGERWLVTRRILNEPPIVIMLAAPLEPYTAPLRTAARRGALALGVVTVAVLLLTMIVAGRLTGSLEKLADAADAVAQGDLERHVSASGSDEVGRLARAFNSMTASLRQTLRELTQRQSIAAVGEFAASLAHEIRNPLTAIRIDLQRAEEQLSADSDLRVPLSRALQEVTRLDRTVGGALRVARGGSIEKGLVDLRDPLERAIHAAEPAFLERAAELEPLQDGAPIHVHGDAGALQQVFINLLLNAAQALDEGGRAGVEVHRHDGFVVVAVWDSGTGMSPDVQSRAFQPFYSTKPEGTGLGLAVARQIVLAHGGEIEAGSRPGAGTRVSVRLPAAQPTAATVTERVSAG